MTYHFAPDSVRLNRFWTYYGRRFAWRLHIRLERWPADSHENEP
jgi:hypothetical protein